MSVSLLMLVALSATLHVLWNMLVKSSQHKMAFALLTSIVASICLFPVWLCIHQGQSASMQNIFWGYAALSGFFEAAYTLTLFYAYRFGDLSVIYPLSRGCAPIISLLLGGLCLGDYLSSLQIAAIVTICAGVSAVAFSGRGVAIKSIPPALGAGMFIAGYHLVDRRAMSHLQHPHPLEYLFAMHCFLLLFISLWVLGVQRGYREIQIEWQENRRSVLLVGIFSPLAYLLIILAMQFGNVTTITATRNIGIVLSTVLGKYLLKEYISGLRALGTAGIALGVIGLALLS